MSSPTVIQLSAGEQQEILATNVLALAHGTESERLWRDARTGSYLVAESPCSSAHALALLIKGKRVGTGADMFPGRPLQLVVAPRTLLDTPKDLSLIGERSAGVYAHRDQSMGDDQRWGESGSAPSVRLPELSWKVPPYTLHFASSDSDFRFIADIGEQHPFGARESFCAIIVANEHEMLGALLAQPQHVGYCVHTYARRIFGPNLPMIQAGAATISRILVSPLATYKWEIHRVLIEQFLQLAPGLVAGSLSVVDAVSYDYHPLALSLGFHVETPDSPEGSFYYWKAFNIPVNVSTQDPLTVKAAAQHLLQDRKKIRRWVTKGIDTDVLEACESGEWLIRKTPGNSGRWRSLAEGHEIWMAGDNREMAALGHVTGTSLAPSIAPFGLRIHFETVATYGFQDFPTFPNLDHDSAMLANHGLVPLGS